jgi:hypothetical protein
MTATLRDPLPTLAKADALLKTLRVGWRFAPILEKFDGARLGFNQGDFLLGLAAPQGRLNSVYVFAVVPTPVESIVAALDGDMTGTVGIVSLGGLEFAARSVSGKTMLVPIEKQALLDQAQAAEGIDEATRASGDLTVTISSQGIDLLRRRVAERSEHAGRTPIALNQMGWPPSPKWLDAAIGANAPLVERMSRLFNTFSAGVSLGDDGEIALVVSGDLWAPAKTQATGYESDIAAASLPPLERKSIAVVSGSAADGSLGTLAELVLAYSEGRPDDVELPAYQREAYAQIEDRVTKAVGLVLSADAALLDRLEDDPFESNRVAIVETSDADRFVKLLTESAKLWNAMLRNSNARTKLLVEIDEVPLLGDGRPTATRFTTDVGAAIETPPSPETQAIMRRFYGPSGKHVLHLVPLGGERLLIGDVSEEELRKVGEQSLDQRGAANAAWEGELHIDRYAAWQNRILAEYMQDALGFTPPNALEAAPVRFGMSQSENQWRLEGKAPHETIEALGRYIAGRK